MSTLQEGKGHLLPTVVPSLVEGHSCRRAWMLVMLGGILLILPLSRERERERDVHLNTPNIDAC